jgi:PKD repeat protein
MDYKSQRLEELFQKAYQKHTQVPSAKVLRRLRFRLWMSDFFSFKPRKLNVYYITLLTGSIISVFILTNKPNQVAEVTITDIQKAASDGKSIQKSFKNENLNETRNNDNNLNHKKIRNDLGNMLTASFNASSLEGCMPLTVYFYDQSKNAVSVKWDFGDGNTSTNLNPDHTFTKAGIYKVTLKISNYDGQQASYSKEVTVLERPQAAMKIEMDNSGSSREVVFKSISKGGSSYSWDFGDSSGSESENTKHIYSNYGIYYVTLVTTASNGCKDTARLNNNFVDKDYELSFPFNFRPNTSGPGNNGYYQSAGTETYIFYPKNYGAQKYELKVFAPNGAEVFSTTDIKQGWNGYAKGRLVPAGEYSYEARGLYPNGKSFEIKGKVKVVIEDYFQN